MIELYIDLRYDSTPALARPMRTKGGGHSSLSDNAQQPGQIERQLPATSEQCGPVGFRPNVIQVELFDDGEPRIWSEAE